MVSADNNRSRQVLGELTLVENRDDKDDNHSPSRACTTEEAISLVYARSVGVPECDFVTVLVISKDNDPRWVLDERALKNVDLVWSDWIPYSRKSQIAWRLFRLVTKLGFLAKLPGVELLKLGNSGLQDGLRQCKSIESCVPIIFIGKPSVTAKLTVFMSNKDDSISAVVKIPLSPAAARSVAVESFALRSLSSLVPGVPTLISHDESTGLSVQSWLSGRTVDRSLKQKQVDFLLSLPRIEDKRPLRELTIQVIESLPNKYRTVSSPFLDLIGPSVRVCTVWEHGDFVPWNMKESDSGELRVVDWEYSDSFGLPLLDLCHFFYRQQFLFADLGTIPELLNNNKLVRHYCRNFTLEDDVLRALQSHYLIRCLTRLIPNSSKGSTYEHFVLKSLEILSGASDQDHYGWT